MRTRVPVAGYEAVAAAAALGSRTYSESLDADSGGTDQGVYLIPAVGSTVGTGGTGALWRRIPPWRCDRVMHWFLAYSVHSPGESL